MANMQRYVSDELIHFVGGKSIGQLDKQYNTLIKILNEGWVTHPPHEHKVHPGNTIRHTSNAI